jgi:hypothetical protein
VSSEAAKVVVEPLSVRVRLRELGLKAEDLTGALMDGASAMALCDENHPPIYPGLSFWAESVRGLRSRKNLDGWVRNDARNYSTVVNAERTTQIAIARGDEWTGIERVPDGKPSTQHKKGPSTQQAVASNQFTLFDRLPEPESEAENSLTTWVLLHFRESNKIRCELSQPTSINKSGFVEKWAERIILSVLDLDTTKIKLPDDEPVQPDVQVKRRA